MLSGIQSLESCCSTVTLCKLESADQRVREAWWGTTSPILCRYLGSYLTVHFWWRGENPSGTSLFLLYYYSWDLNCVLINYLLLHCLLGCSWNQRGTTSYEIWSNRGIWHWSDSYNCREVLYSSHWVENLIYLLCIKCCFSYITDYPLHFHVLVGTSVFSKHPICYRLNRCCRKNGMHMLIGVALMCMNAFA
jgi:hypothetical protein